MFHFYALDSALFSATRDNAVSHLDEQDLAKMTSLCVECEELFKETDGDLGDTLRDTAENCHEDCLQWLVDQGANMNIHNDYGYGETPLHEVAKKGNYNCVKLLIKAGADVNEKSSRATRVGYQGPSDADLCAELRYKIRTDVDDSYYGDDALMFATENESIECVNLLLKAGANVNSESYNGNTALNAAASKGALECVKTLVEAGANVNYANGNLHGNSALLLATNGSHFQCVEYLVKSGAIVNMRNDDGSTPLMDAAKEGNAALINFLIAEGADVNVADNRNHSALSFAALHGQNKNIKLLLQAGADVKSEVSGDRPTVYYVATICSAQILWLFIKAGADVNVLVACHKTLLIAVANHNNRYGCECIKLLLMNGAKIKQVDSDGHNALRSHIRHRTRVYLNPDADICMLLFAAGETPDGTSSLPHCLRFDSLRLCLKHLCREAIRNRLRLVDQKDQSLFHLVPKLGLPSLLTEYLLYDVSLDVDINDDDNDDDVV